MLSWLASPSGAASSGISVGATSSFAGGGLSSLRTFMSFGTTAAGAACFVSTFGGVAGVMFAGYQSFITPEAFSLQESIMIVAMVVLGGIGHIPGVIVGALLLAALPEVLRYVAGPLQAATDGRLDASILRQLLIATAMIVIMLLRPRGLWPSPEHGKAAPTPASK